MSEYWMTEIQTAEIPKKRNLDFRQLFGHLNQTRPVKIDL